MNDKLNEILNQKIQKIDSLLSDDVEFEEYIKKIEDTQISNLNHRLEEKILSRVNKVKKVYYFNLCKIAACMILAIILCQTDYIKNTNFNNTHQLNKEVVQKSNFLTDKINQVNNFLMKPINMEKEEK